jgi:metal-dependent amidase/aminoacylase/carboxypeptidase family protein
VLENAREAADWLCSRAASVLGAESVVAPCTPWMAGEDFAYFLREVPGAFAFLGCAKDGSSLSANPPNHHPSFDVDEDCLPAGAAVLASLALSPGPKARNREGDRETR